MKQPWRPRVLIGVVISVVIGAIVLAGAGTFVARAADPIKIGFGMALTGGLSANGKPALLALQIWKDDVNKKGGLLGRPVELVFYDDQTNPATVPGIYSKLLDVDKVDLVTSGYGTNLIAPAHAHRHGAQAHDHGDLRAREQREVQVPELLPDLAQRARAGDEHRARLLRAGRPPEPQAPDGGASSAPTRSTRRTRWWGRAS